MEKNRGTEWQNIFSDICEKNKINCVRFYDTMQGFKGVDNPCDFVISKDKKLPQVLIECKSTHSTSFGLGFSQYERLINLDKFYSVVLIWFVNKKQVCALDIHYIKELRDSGVKSYNPDKRSDKGCLILESNFARIKPKDLKLEAIWDILREK